MNQYTSITWNLSKMKIFVDENELACDSSDSDTNFGTIGHDSSSEFEEETQAGPASATWLPQSNTAGSRVISFKGFIFIFHLSKIQVILITVSMLSYAATVGIDTSRKFSVFTLIFVVLLQKYLTCCIPLHSQ